MGALEARNREHSRLPAQHLGSHRGPRGFERRHHVLPLRSHQVKPGAQGHKAEPRSIRAGLSRR